MGESLGQNGYSDDDDDDDADEDDDDDDEKCDDVKQRGEGGRRQPSK